MSPGILLIDDHAVVRDGLRFLLERAGWEVVADCADAGSALNTLARTPCGLVILDLNLPGEDGFLTLVQIRERFPDLPILVLSMHGDRTSVVRALHAGAHGYVVKSASREELLAAISTVHGGGSYLDPRVAGTVLDELRNRACAPEAAPASERDVTLLGLLAQGLNNQQIAERMHLSLSSVKLHLSELFARHGVSDRVSLVVAAMEKGLLPRREEGTGSGG